MSAARRIGDLLREAMNRRGFDVGDVARMTGKRPDHIEAILAGYPNSRVRPTQLDTVDEVAAALELKLDLSDAD